MKRRCWFLDNLPAYNYNRGVGVGMEKGKVTDTKHLGSTLMALMIREAAQVCQPGFDDEDRDYHQDTGFSLSWGPLLLKRMASLTWTSRPTRWWKKISTSDLEFILEFFSSKLNTTRLLLHSNSCSTAWDGCLVAATATVLEESAF